MNDMSPLPAQTSVPVREIHHLVRDGDIGRLRAAIEAGIDLNARDRHGQTLLLVAVQHRRLDIMMMLGKAGADPDLAHDRVGHFTPLHEAAWRNNLDSVEALLELGADATRRTWLTPIDWAESRAVIEALVAAGGDPNARCPSTGHTPLHRRACRCLAEPMAALLDAGADIAARDLQGRTPLHHVTLGHTRGDVAQAVKLLLDAGADPQALDGKSEAVMDLARRRRDVMAVRALVEAGADKTAGNANGRPPFGLVPRKVPESAKDAIRPGAGA